MRSNRTEENYIGTFGYLKNAAVKDLGVDINKNYEVAGKSYVGGIAGRAENSSIVNCYVTGIVMATDSYGGMIVGRADSSSIENCYYITGPTSMKLTAGYVAISSSAFAIEGAPAPVVTKYSGNDAVTWNNTAKTLDVAAGLLPGMYYIVLSADNGFAPDAALTFTLSVNAAGTTSPGIIGPTAMTLNVGYAATSSKPFTITGTPAPTVTMISGIDAITWNDSAKKLDIAAGLPMGTYNVELSASNGVVHNELTFILSVLPKSTGDDPIVKGGGGGCNIGCIAIMFTGIALFARKIIRN